MDFLCTERTFCVHDGFIVYRIYYTLITSVLWEKGFLIAQGICPTVGIGGLTLGGGYGHFSRLFGLVSDNVLEMEMVGAKGQLIVINDFINKDLFWALRGGGGGNFGIVSKFKFRMHRTPKSIVCGEYAYSFKDFTRFYSAWQALIASGLPNNIFSLLELEKDFIQLKLYAFNAEHLLNITVDKIENFQYSFQFPVANNSSTKLMSYSDFLMSEAQPYSDTLITHPSQLATMTRHNHIGWKKVKSIYVNKILNEVQIVKLKDLLIDYLPYAGFNIEFYGGAIDNFSPTTTSFFHRGKNMYHLQLKPLNAQGVEPNLKTDSVMKTFYERSKAIFNHQESYQNYLDQDVTDGSTRLYGTNLQKLIKIKKRIDPDNVFNHPQSIPLNFWLR